MLFSINTNSCRGSELSRDPGSSMGDVHRDCCFHSCYESWFVVAFRPGEARGVCFPPYRADLFLCLKCLSECFSSKIWKIFRRLGHVHLENNGLAHLISSRVPDFEKMLGNCKWCIALKREIRRHTKLCHLLL